MPRTRTGSVSSAHGRGGLIRTPARVPARDRDDQGRERHPRHAPSRDCRDAGTAGARIVTKFPRGKILDALAAPALAMKPDTEKTRASQILRGGGGPT